MTEAPQQTIHLFRHAEAAHNVASDYSIRDPRLTKVGLAQAEQIPTTYNFFNHPTLVLVSPFQRTIQTALYAFHPHFNKEATKLYPQGPPRFIALPHLQEVSELPCDTGSSLSSLRKEYGEYVDFPDEHFDSDDWFRKENTPFAYDTVLISKRAKFVREYLKQCQHEEVIVVTHGDFYHFLVNRGLYGPDRGSRFDNLKYAAGLPMVFKAKSEEDDSDLEMTIEIPAWWFDAESDAETASP